MHQDEGGKDGQLRGPVPLSRNDFCLIVILALVQFTHIVDFVIVMPLGLQLMAELQISPGQFSRIVSLYGLAAAAANIVAAAVVDRLDRKTVLLISFAGFSFSTLACGLSDSYPSLLVARSMAGMFGGLAAATIMAVIGDAFPAEKRGRATGAVLSAFAVASIAGLPLGLLLANQHGWGAPFIALAAVCLVIWIAVWRYLPSFCGHTAYPRQTILRDYWQLLQERRHLLALLWTALLVHGTFTIIPFLGPYLLANVRRSQDDLPFIYAVAGLCTLVSMNLIGSWSDRFGKRPLFQLLALLTLIVTLVVTNLPPVSLLVATMMATLFMVGASGRMIPAQAMMMSTATPAMRGSFLSLNTAVQHLAIGIAPMISGALMSRGSDGSLIGYPTVGLVATGFALLSLLLSGRIHPAPTEPTARVALSLQASEKPAVTADQVGGEVCGNFDSNIPRHRVTTS
jgi:predicted MFS family arabinose efflux permease